MIIAKPVVQNRFWILKKDDEKIGNIEAVDNEFQVRINDQITRFKTIKMISQRTDIEFQKLNKRPKEPDENFQVHGFYTGCKSYNPTWDVQKGLPLFTKTTKSKSWFAAGWFLIKQHRTWDLVHCPKLIALQRYPYRGPFYTEDQARDQPF